MSSPPLKLQQRLDYTFNHAELLDRVLNCDFEEDTELGTLQLVGRTLVNLIIGTGLRDGQSCNRRKVLKDLKLDQFCSNQLNAIEQFNLIAGAIYYDSDLRSLFNVLLMVFLERNPDDELNHYRTVEKILKITDFSHDNFVEKLQALPDSEVSFQDVLKRFFDLEKEIREKTRKVSTISESRQSLASNYEHRLSELSQLYEDSAHESESTFADQILDENFNPLNQEAPIKSDGLQKSTELMTIDRRMTITFDEQLPLISTQLASKEQLVRKRSPSQVAFLNNLESCQSSKSSLVNDQEFMAFACKFFSMLAVIYFSLYSL